MDNHTQNRNNKKILVIISAAIVVIAAVLISGLLLTHTNANGISQPASIGIKDAKVLPKDNKCLANNVATKTQVQTQKGLGEDGGFWTSYIYDVPAGTNVDVSIATYNGNNVVTGSLAYSNQYGSYNFTATKKADEWRYTSFEGCQ